MDHVIAIAVVQVGILVGYSGSCQFCTLGVGFELHIIHGTTENGDGVPGTLTRSADQVVLGLFHLHRVLFVISVAAFIGLAIRERFLIGP